MEPAARLRRVARVLMCPEEDEAFLFDPQGGGVKLLNPTGALVWRLLDGDHDAAAITGAVCAAWPEAAPAAVGADVVRFLESLLEAGLAEVVVV